MKNKYYIPILFALLTSYSTAATASCPSPPGCTYTGLEVEPLFFGQIIITGANTSSYSCTITAGGSMTCDSGITVINPGQAQYGVFQLSGYDPTVYMWACVDDHDTILTDPNGTTHFDIKDFTFAPAYHSISTEGYPAANGTLMLEVGATLKTVIGETYDIAPYHGTYTLQINY